MTIDQLKQKNLTEDTRHFVDFPEVIFFDEFADHVEELPGAEIIRYEADGTIGIWVEFTYSENTFYVTNKFGDYQFYVKDKECPDFILLEIADHFRRILEENSTAMENYDYLAGNH